MQVTNATLGVALLAFAIHSMLFACSPAADREVKLTFDDAAHKAAIIKCREDAKKQPEGFQFSAFCTCWYDVNAQYHVDAGACTR